MRDSLGDISVKSSALTFTHPLNVGARAYLDLTQIGAWRKFNLLYGRLTFEIDNLFNSSLKIRAKKGEYLQYDDGVEPLDSRVIHLTFRRNF
jgi:hypothetical protein